MRPVRGPAPQCLGGPFCGDYAHIEPGRNAFQLGGHLYVLTREDDGSYFWLYAGMDWLPGMVIAA